MRGDVALDLEGAGVVDLGALLDLKRIVDAVLQRAVGGPDVLYIRVSSNWLGGGLYVFVHDEPGLGSPYR